jgi:catechol 2,3-dioxygenase-like lactoylglutathione lyase family enzyme
MKLKNILLVVNDIEVSKKFYTEFFGLMVKVDFGKNVMLTEGLVLQEKTVWEEALDKKVCMGGHDAELYFEESDMDGFLEKLADADILSPCMTDANGQRVVRLYDPDKHVIEVKEVVWGR